MPKVTLTWKITPDKMVYATYSKGFRPGGVNRIAGPNGVPYQPDFLKNYEIGWKTTWFDHRLRWNGALFWEDWKNFQFGFLVPPSITAITNAGNARIKGIENDIQFAPTNNLTLSANFTLAARLYDHRLLPGHGSDQRSGMCERLTAERAVPAGRSVPRPAGNRGHGSAPGTEI